MKIYEIGGFMELTVATIPATVPRMESFLVRVCSYPLSK